MADKAQIIVEAVDKASGVFASIGGAVTKMAAVGAAAAVGGIAAISAGIIKATSTAADFETGMNNFAAAAGKSLDEAGLKTQDFQKLFLDLGKKLPVSTMEVADAATALVKGGLDPAVIAAGGLESSLKFAAAAQMDLTAAAEVGIKQLSIFTDVTATTAEKTEFLAKAQDLLVKAAGASTTDVAQLSDAVLMSGGQAKAAGLEYSDFITSITMVADKMPSAAEAGTSFKNMLVRLQPTTKDAVLAFKELGLTTFDTQHAMEELRRQGIDPTGMSADQMRGKLLSNAEAIGMTKKQLETFIGAFDKSAFYDAEGNFVGMRDAASKLSEAFKGLTEEDRIRYAQMMFGNDGMAAAMALIEGGTAGYDKYTKAIGDANGVQAQSEATQKGLKFQLDQFNGSMEALAISIGTKVLPYATKFIEEFVMPAVNGLIDLVSNTEGVGGAMDGLAASLGPAMDGAKKVMNDVVTWVQANWPAIQATIQSVVDAAIAFINDPFIPTINKIIEAIKGVADWITTNWPKIQPIITDVMNAISTVINDIVLPVLAKILEAAKGLVEWFINNWPAIKEAVAPIVDQMVKKLNEIKDTIILAFDQAKTIGTKIGEIKTAVETKWQEIQTFVEGLPQAFVNAGTAIMQGLINGVVAKLKEFGDLWNRLSQDPIKTMGEVLNMHSPSQVMFDMGENIMKGLIYGVASYRNKAVQVMSDTAQAITDAAAYQLPAVNGSVAAGQDAFDRGSGRLGGALVPSMAAAGAGMTGSLPQQFNATMNINVVMDGAVLASTVVSIVQGILQQEKQRYGQP